MKRNKDRVVFYSKTDLTASENLSKAEPKLRGFNPHASRDINDILELYHIKLLIDSDLYLDRWTGQERKLFKESTIRMWNTINLFWQGVDDGNFKQNFEKLEYDYRYGFWEIVEKLKVYKKVTADTFSEILVNESLWVRVVLQHRNTVNHFGNEIQEYLLSHPDSAELLLNQFQWKLEPDRDILFFPKCISDSDKEQIILNYLDSENPNLNYVRLITNTKDNQLKLKPRTRLKAKQLEADLNDRILAEGSPMTVGNGVSIVDDQEEPEIEEREKNNHIISYSADWIDKLTNEVSLSPLFVSLFKYMEHGCISLVSKPNELDPIEPFFMRSKDDYLTGITFNRKNRLSFLQLFTLCKYLEGKSNSIESILHRNVDNYLNDKLDLKNCRINFPSENSTPLEKVRLLIPEIESVLKQFALFAEEGEIDHDLVQLYSRSVSFSKVPSLVDKKYVYGIGKEHTKLSYWFFSDQSPLHYIKSIGSKYRHFYGLLSYENVRISDFAEYQKRAIDDLIQNGHLIVDADKYLRIKNDPQIFIIGALYLNEVVNYWHFTEENRKVMDSMENEGLLSFSSTLFSLPESKYFNFFLNKAEFTNGLDLRNKYAHGTNTTDAIAHESDYFLLLRILILILLKIEDDIYCFKRMKSIGSTH